METADDDREAKDSKEETSVNLDTILTEEIGEFGKYQKRALGLYFLIVLFGGYSTNEYIFTAARIQTRCLIPECESDVNFSPPWLANAIPREGGSIDNCHRFNRSGVILLNNTCPAKVFDPHVIVPCEEYVYENEKTIVYEFGLACQEWRRSLVGSVSTLGMMLSLPLTGFISDRYGRRIAITTTAFSRGWFGLFRYWATSYNSFIVLEFLEAVASYAIFSCVFTVAMEFMGPKYRVAAGAATSTFFSSGLILQALMAWLLPYWRHLILALYIPQFSTILFFWIMPESIRWYLSKGRYAEAEAELKRAAKLNGKELSETSLRKLKESAEEETRKIEVRKKLNTDDPCLVTLVFQHKRILLRCILAPVWWITMTLVFYGLSMNAVTMSGNKYWNYMAVAAVDIPAFWTAVWLFDRIGRKPLLFCAFWFCAVCQIGFIFMPEGWLNLSLAVYLVGKYCISIVVTSLYTFTNEIFPTRYRTRLVAFSSMVGRIGSIVAPLTPALGTMVWVHLPFVLFGGLAALSGTLVLLAPETKGSTLPDTMQQAGELGKRRNTK